METTMQDLRFALLFGLTATDPLTLAGAAMLLMSVAAVAAYSLPIGLRGLTRLLRYRLNKGSQVRGFAGSQVQGA